MTRAEMRARVRFFIDEPVQQNFTDADINTAINIAQHQVQLEIVQVNEDYFVSPTPVTIVLAGATETYALHTDSNGECDVLKIKRVEDGATGLDIDPADQNEKQMLPGSLITGLASGAPSKFYLLGNYIGFTPVPAQAGTAKYWFVPMLADLTSDTDRSQIPRVLHDLIPIRAAIDNFVKDQESITELTNLWDRGVNLARRVVNNRQIMAPKRVRQVE